MTEGSEWGECTACWPVLSPPLMLLSLPAGLSRVSHLFCLSRFPSPLSATSCFTRFALCLQSLFGEVLPEKMSNGMLKGIRDKEAVAEPVKGPLHPSSSPTFIDQETSL